MSASGDERAAMATALAGATVNGKPVPVYAVSPHQITPPCIILEPADPFLTKTTLSRATLRIDATCMVPITSGPGGDGVDLERLEYLAEWVLTHWPHTEPARAPLTGDVGGVRLALVTVPLSSIITV